MTYFPWPRQQLRLPEVTGLDEARALGESCVVRFDSLQTFTRTVMVDGKLPWECFPPEKGLESRPELWGVRLLTSQHGLGHLGRTPERLYKLRLHHAHRGRIYVWAETRELAAESAARALTVFKLSDPKPRDSGGQGRSGTETP